MSEITRKRFLGLGAAATAAGASGCDWAPDDPTGSRILTPDLVVHGAKVYTVDDANPTAEAFAVKNGRFVAVGSNADVLNMVGPGTEVIDATGMTVTPGFIDAHTHPPMGGIQELVNVNVGVPSIAEMKDLLAARAAQTPPGEWVIGFMYDDTKLSEGRSVLRTDLDEAVPDHPTVIRHRGGHTAVYNSAAFTLAGITFDTPDPQGGQFYREAGELTGKVVERAREAIDRLIPSETTRDQRRDGVSLISQKMAAAGLTSIHDTGVTAEQLTAYQDARDAGEMRFRAYILPGFGNLFSVLNSTGIRTGFGDDSIRIGAAKYGADGSASERTMSMSTPYVGRPDDYGILTMSQQEIHEVVEEAHRSGWQVGIHANGDVAIDMVLNAYERMQAEYPRPDARHRIEHCTLVTEDLLRRIAAVGAIPTPFYTYVYYHGEKWEAYGEEKVSRMFAHRSFLDHGIPVAPASDYTPGPFEPLMAIQSMVSRTDYRGKVWGANQKVSVDEALKICTYNGAYASHEESSKGSIAAGKLADFVILSEDPHDVDENSIMDIDVVRTVLGGATTFEA